MKLNKETWHRGRAGAYFDHPYFLDHFDFSYRGEKFQFRDPLHRPFGPPDDPLMVYPSFLKKLAGTELRAIWIGAAEALRRATDVEVRGYSLPESDSAARVLLNTLFARSEAGELAVRVHDPDPQTRQRWKEFCPRSVIDEEPLE